MATWDEDYAAYVRKAMGPEAEVIRNEKGAEQSLVPFRFALIPPEAVFRLAEIMAHGEQKGYGRNNWRGIPFEDHVDHALSHLFAFLLGDGDGKDKDDHLGHAFCRLAFAVSIQQRRKEEDGWNVNG